MRIAVFEPLPRMCGVTAWTFHAAQGFRDLGHHCDVVSFTKSGRRRTTLAKRKDGSIGAGWHWWPESPNVVEKWVNAPSVLDSYDLIVLNEPKNATMDREAIKQGFNVPEYVNALRGTRTPWTTILHAPQYDQKRAPFLEATMNAGNFTGMAIEHQPGSFDSRISVFEPTIQKTVSWPWLPYRQRGFPEGVERQWNIGIGGRMTTSKGQAALAYHAEWFPHNLTARIFGGESGGIGASHSFSVYEALVKDLGFTGTRDGQSETCSDIGNYGDIIFAWPWRVQKINDLGMHRVEFTAAYSDQLKPWGECAIAINLTNKAFAVGVEYTTLEAMDAGCVIVAPKFSFVNTGSEQYDAFQLSTYEQTNGVSRGRFTGHVDDDLIIKVIEATEYAKSGHDPDRNRKALTDYHAPRFLADAILHSLGE